jgi:hypothetical protein
VPEKRRRITCRKLRGEWSEGLLLPTKDFIELTDKLDNVTCIYDDNYDVSEVLKIEHYDPDRGVENTGGGKERGPQKTKKPKSLKGWFYFIARKLGFDLNGLTGGNNEDDIRFPIYDVEAYKNYVAAFTPKELVVVTEKIHGSNFRAVDTKGHFYVGSRTLWKSPESNCIWRKCVKQNPWIEEWCRAHEDFVLYGEVVPSQKGFNYGCKDGEVKLFVFDVFTPEGKWVKPFKIYNIPSENILVDADKHVPILALIPFDIEEIKKYVDGPSRVKGANHIREGIVIIPVIERHVHGLGRLQLKLVSNAFLEKDNK